MPASDTGPILKGPVVRITPPPRGDAMTDILGVPLIVSRRTMSSNARFTLVWRVAVRRSEPDQNVVRDGPVEIDGDVLILRDLRCGDPQVPTVLQERCGCP